VTTLCASAFIDQLVPLQTHDALSATPPRPAPPARALHCRPRPERAVEARCPGWKRQHSRPRSKRPISGSESCDAPSHSFQLCVSGARRRCTCSVLPSSVAEDRMRDREQAA
jgi:hypothetical protein